MALRCTYRGGRGRGTPAQGRLDCNWRAPPPETPRGAGLLAVLREGVTFAVQGDLAYLLSQFWFETKMATMML